MSQRRTQVWSRYFYEAKSEFSIPSLIRLVWVQCGCSWPRCQDPAPGQGSRSGSRIIVSWQTLGFFITEAPRITQVKWTDDQTGLVRTVTEGDSLELTCSVSGECTNVQSQYCHLLTRYLHINVAQVCQLPQSPGHQMLRLRSWPGGGCWASHLSTGGTGVTTPAPPGMAGVTTQLWHTQSSLMSSVSSEDGHHI